MSGLPAGDQTRTALVDLHCHVLPAVDDGAVSLGEALAMLREAVDAGICLVVATPHSDRCPPESARAAVAELRAQAAAAGLGVELAVGAEYPLDAELMPAWQAGRVLPLAGSAYLLVELRAGFFWSPAVSDLLYRLQLEGAIPVLAHPERIPAVQQDPSLLEPLARSGIVLQVNAGSLLGRYGSRVRRTVETLVECDLAHIVASDAHRVGELCELPQALDRIAELVGQETRQAMIARAQQIARGLPVDLPEPRSRRRRPLLVRWFRR